MRSFSVNGRKPAGGIAVPFSGDAVRMRLHRELPQGGLIQGHPEPVSGRQTIRAPSRPASSTATAAGTAASSVVVSGVEATAIRIVDMPAVYLAESAL